MEEIVSRIEEHIGKSVSEWLVLWCIYMNYYNHSDTLLHMYMYIIIATVT